MRVAGDEDRFEVLVFFALHQWASYATVALMLAHPIVLLWIKAPVFRIVDLVWPVHSPLQPLINLAGAGALYLLALLLLTSLVRNTLGRRLWRNLHYLAFPAVVLMFLHSLLTDPNLKDGHPDMLDGGKVFLEVATLLSVVAIAWRAKLRGQGLRVQRGATTLRESS